MKLKKINRILALGLACIGLNSFAVETPTPPTNAKVSGTQRIQAGDMAPDFTVIDAEGNPIRLSDFRGKTVLLDFWATWCGPCIKAMPKYSELAKARADDGLVVLSICVADTRENYDAWVAENGDKFHFTTAHDPVGKDLRSSIFSKVYGVGMLPTLFVVDREGKLTGRVITYPEEKANLDTLLIEGGLPDPTQAAMIEERPEPRFRGYLGKMLAGDPLEQVDVETIDGDLIALSDLSAESTTLLRVFKAPHMDDAQIEELNYWQSKYADAGLKVIALAGYTSREIFDDWWATAKDKIQFTVVFDPAGASPSPTKPRDEMSDSELEAYKQAMRAHFAKAVPMVLAEGLMVPIPHTLIIQDPYEFVGVYVGSGEQTNESLQNLLLRANIELAPEDRPKYVYSEEETAPEEKIPMIEIGKAAPDFIAYDIHNQPIKVSDYLGKVVVLDFWATWCGPCKKAIPHLQEVARKYKDQGVVVLGSCTRDTREEFEKWMAVNGDTYPDVIWASDPEEKGANRASRKLYGVQGIPTQFIIGRDGTIVASTIGYLPGEVLVDAALAEAGIDVAPEILEKAEEDRKNRERMSN
jgi:thiol-disulfide isomerase/thioredoxin